MKAKEIVLKKGVPGTLQNCKYPENNGIKVRITEIEKNGDIHATALSLKKGQKFISKFLINSINFISD